jgi:hypothetical protein
MIDVVRYDFTDAFNWFLNQFLNIIRYCFDQLDAITISGVSLLDISVTILILGAILPIVFTFATSSVSASRNYSINEKRNSYSSYKKQRDRNKNFANKYRKEN